MTEAIRQAVILEDVNRKVHSAVAGVEALAADIRRELARLDGPLPPSLQWLANCVDDIDAMVWRYRRFRSDDGGSL